MAPIIEDWFSDIEDESKPNDPQNVPSFVHPTEHVIPFRHSDQPVEAPILAATPKPTSPKTNCSSKRKNRKTCFVCRSVDHLIKDCNFHAKPKIQPTPRNYAHRELNGGYVAFGGNPKGGKISGKGKIKTDFKLPDESQVLLIVPRKNNMYNVNLKYIVPFRDLTCLFAKATIDESNLWHRRLGHINFKTVNKLVKGNLVRGLPTKVFKNHNTCVACKKGKQHRTSCKANPDETSPILKTFITGLENQLSLKVKVIRSDNGIEFKNSNLNQFYRIKGIKREFSVPRTPQQNGIAERKNRTLIEAARTMLADSLLPIPFWAEVVNTACYVQNRVLVTKPLNKTPYKFLHGRTPSISFMRPFGCPVTILNTLDSLGKFNGKVDEGFLVGYSVNSTGPTWLFDINSLTKTMNYQPVTTGNQTNPSVGDAAFDGKEHDTKKPKSLVNLSPSNKADFNNLETSITVSPIPTTRIHNVHPISQIIGNLSLTTQTRSMTRVIKDQGRLSQIFNDDFYTCMYACFLSQEEPKRVHQALKDPSWIEAINKKDERGIVVRNKARLIAQGHTQEEGIDYEEVFAPVARIEAIRLFLAYASFMGFMVYQMDVKSAFTYETIEEEVYICQPLRFEDPDHPDKVYKVVKALYGLHQAPRAWLTKRKSASTPIDTEKPLLKDPD
nr:retrovirus-related Pol polyprotein from transposon TNT 1-94 [Tanacetum cinerariifolium]